VPELKLSPEEAQVLRKALSALAIRQRTGELGILHGMERFVSTNVSFRRPDLEALDAAARRLGLPDGVRRTQE
jgi:hypothetical protein